MISLETLTIVLWYCTFSDEWKLRFNKISHRIVGWKSKENSVKRFQDKVEDCSRSQCNSKVILPWRLPCWWISVAVGLATNGTVSTGVNDMNYTVCPRGQKPNERRSKRSDRPEVEVMWSSPAFVLIVLLTTVGFLFLTICNFILFKVQNTSLVKVANS